MNNYLPRIWFSFLLMFVWAQSHAQVTDSCTFVQKDGILTVEMESANLNGTFWTLQSDKPGYTGDGYVQFLGGDATGNPGRNMLTYTFRITQPGRHSFKLMGFRQSHPDNDVWVRFPKGGVVTKMGNDSTGTMGSNWFKAMIGARDRWYGFVKTQHLHTSWGETLHDIYVDFPEAGVYTVEFSGRATGFSLDRFMLYTGKSSFQGMNPANPESDRENCTPFNMEGKVYVANPVPNVTINANEQWTFTVPANTFAGAETIPVAAYSTRMSALPSWITFDQATDKFVANPTYANGGEHTILLVANVNGVRAVNSFTINVLGNNPPVLAKPLEDSIAYTEQLFVYDIASNFTDADGHALTYTITSNNGGEMPEWLTMQGTVFSGTPQASHIGRDTIYIKVDDGNGGVDSSSFLIYVRPAIATGTVKSQAKLNAVIYPNPATDVITINMQEQGEAQVLLTDQLGKVLVSESVNMASSKTFDLTSLNIPSGIYFVKIKSSENGAEFNSTVIKK